MSVKKFVNIPHKNDWHKEDIKAALRKKGWSIRQLAFKHGYTSSSALVQTLYRPFPKGEKIIAEAIGVCANDIWPSRFEERNLKKIVGVNV